MGSQGSGFHDSLAARAAEMGKAADEFKAGARRKARVTGLLLVVAAVVLYFAGWPWALIPAAVAAFTALQSFSAAQIAVRLEKAERSAKAGQPATM